MSQPPSPVPDDPVLTTRAVAKLLGVSVSTAQLWIESGAIESWKTPGGHRRVRLSAVVELLERQGKRETSDVAPPGDAGDEFRALPQPGYPAPPDEAERLQALAATRLVDSPPEQVFDRLTWLATRITETPVALVSLLTSRRQWFKSRIGVDVAETPRDWAFCSHAILNEGPLIVENALEDERFRDNPLVTGAPHIRFYAGFPLNGRRRLRLGTLCVLDSRPRRLSEEQLQALRELASIASEEILRRSIS